MPRIFTIGRRFRLARVGYRAAARASRCTCRPSLMLMPLISALTTRPGRPAAARRLALRAEPTRRDRARYMRKRGFSRSPLQALPLSALVLGRCSACWQTPTALELPVVRRGRRRRRAIPSWPSWAADSRDAAFRHGAPISAPSLDMLLTRHIAAFGFGAICLIAAICAAASSHHIVCLIPGKSAMPRRRDDGYRRGRQQLCFADYAEMS